ncbi:MAG TPA: hypothetical protein VFX64_00395 [Candidatus Nitrosotalea sp.]|nr:hypothetical protein [Candidatus Nitrosotalea sp.]
MSAVRFTVNIAKKAKEKDSDPDEIAKLVQNISKWIKRHSAKNGSKMGMWKIFLYVIFPMVALIPLGLITIGFFAKIIIDRWMAVDLYPEYQKETKQIMNFIFGMISNTIAKDMRSRK